MTDRRQTKKTPRAWYQSQIKKACVKRYEPAALGREVSALAVERRLRYSPLVRNIAATGSDATFTIS
jgi:hypothetical protein